MMLSLCAFYMEGAFLLVCAIYFDTPYAFSYFGWSIRNENSPLKINIEVTIMAFQIPNEEHCQCYYFISRHINKNRLFKWGILYSLEK